MNLPLTVTAVVFATLFASVARAEPGQGPDPTPDPAPAAVAPIQTENPRPAERAELSTCDKTGPQNAISTQPLAFFARGVAVSYERLLVPRISLLGIGGYRATAQGDYGSNTIHGGVEGRVWIRPSADIKCGLGIAMSGPFLGLRVGVGYTRLVDKTDEREVGSSIGLSPTAQAGWRFVAYRIIEITPSVGFGVRADVDPPSGLVSAPRPAIALNLSLGWMF